MSTETLILIVQMVAAFGVVVSGILGITIGSLSAQGKRSSRIALGVCDTLQTFPSFIYLIPVIMLFGGTDTAVLIAVVIYATIPATRYTVEGLTSVPTALHDAGSMSGVTRMQRWLKIELPLAFPHIMLGINKTEVFANWFSDKIRIPEGELLKKINLGYASVFERDRVLNFNKGIYSYCPCASFLTS